MCLLLLKDFVLNVGGSNFKEYGLPPTTETGGLLENGEYLRKTNYDMNTLNEIVSRNKASLTNEQLMVFKEI